MLVAWQPRPGPPSSRSTAGEVAVSNPDKVYFPEAGITKLEVVRYYLAVAEGALRHAGGRPNVLVRYANGIHGEFFYQKRAPAARPEWIDVVALRFPSGRTAEEVVPRDAASLAWMANLGCLELHPHPVRAEDLDHPDELRVDLDPVPGVEWAQLQAVARLVREVLAAHGLEGWPKTSGSRGIHVNVRIQPRWSFSEVRRAALALAREVERRAPSVATSKWWKEERHGVFLDYNQNAKDRTVASAYSVRPRAGRARVRAAHLGGARRVPAGGLHAAHACRPASRRSATGTRASTSMPAPWRSCWSSRRDRRPRAWATRRGRRTTRSRPVSRRASSRRRRRGQPGAGRRVPHEAADRDRPCRAASRTRSRGSSAGRRAIPRPRPTSTEPTCWSTRCAGGPPPGPASAEPGARSGGATARPGAARSRAARPGRRAQAVREDPGQLGGRSDLELVVAAVRRRLVGPPAQEDRGVPEPVALEVVVLHLADALDAQRLPRHVLARAPAALGAGHAHVAGDRLRPIAARDGRRGRRRAAAQAPGPASCAPPS